METKERPAVIEIRSMKENNRVKARLNFLLIPRLLQLKTFFFMIDAQSRDSKKNCRRQVHPGYSVLWCVASPGREKFLNASFLSITGKDDIFLQAFEAQGRVVKTQDMERRPAAVAELITAQDAGDPLKGFGPIQGLP